MTSRKLILSFAFLLSATLCAAQITVDATKQGIKGNGKTLNTKKIQKLIDKLSEKGGGCITFPKGTYLTGGLVLKSGVELNLQEGAVLLGSTNPYDYEPLQVSSGQEKALNDNSKLALIVAHQAENIKLTGKGTIDGQGTDLALHIDSLHHIGERVDPNYNYGSHRPNETMRPKLLYISLCKNVLIEDLHMRNSACWGLSFDRCQDMTLQRLDIYNRAFWNNDGIDLTDCKHVRVMHCNFNTADDSMCLKSYHPEDCNDQILISGCNIISSASAIKFGSASYGGFKNVTIENLFVKDTFRSILALESVDGAILENIKVNNVEGVNVGNPIFIRLGQRAGERPGVVRNISICNLKAEMAAGVPDMDYPMRGPAVTYFHNPTPSSITGIPGNKVQGVHIEDVEITYPGNAYKGTAYIPLSDLKRVPEVVKNYPEFSMFGELPAWGFFVRHADKVKFNRVTLKLKGSEFRPAFVFVDSHHNEIKSTSIPVKNTIGEQIYGEDAQFEKMQVIYE